MYISKKKLLSLLSENIKKTKNIEEMAMDFDTEDRPHEDIQGKLETGETPYKKVPLPKTNVENQNFQELLASERYRQVVANLRQYVGENVPPLHGENQLGELANLSVGVLMSILRTEQAHRQQLEELAIDLVKKEMGIPEGAVQFDAKIVGIGEISDEDFNKAKPRNDTEAPEIDDEDIDFENPEDEADPEEENEIDVEETLMNRFEHMSLEKAKRRFINGIIQGASDRGHYMYHYVADRIKEITGSDEIIDQYGIMMSVNDVLYWQMGDTTLDAMMGGGEGGNNASMAGREDVERNTNPPTIKARGVNFPVLVHELIKGTLELFAIQGRPKSEEEYSEVEGEEDTLEKENWDLRLGPAIWDRLRSMFPQDILTDENKIEIQNYILVEIFKLPPKKFFVFMKEVMQKTNRGRQLMDDLVDAINKMIHDQEYEEETQAFHEDLDETTDGISEEDLNSFLNALGVIRDNLGLQNPEEE